jgi:hypothetical protein
VRDVERRQQMGLVRSAVVILEDDFDGGAGKTSGACQRMPCRPLWGEALSDGDSVDDEVVIVMGSPFGDEKERQPESRYDSRCRNCCGRLLRLLPNMSKVKCPATIGRVLLYGTDFS